MPPVYLSRLGEYMKRTRITSLRLAVEAGISRRHVDNLRLGVSDPTRYVMVKVTRAVRSITRLPVPMADLFDLC